jgi:PST family polysaccharide transporter
MISGIAIIVFKKLKLFLSKFNLEIIGKFWRFGKWLIFFHLLKLVNERIDFFWLTRSFSGEILGQYSAALKLVTVFAVLMGTFPILLLPEASSMKNIEDLKRYWRGCAKIIILLLSTWIIVFAFADYIVEILLGIQYIQATPILRILLVSLIPLIFTLPLEFIFLSIEKTIHLFIISAIQSFSIFIVIPIFVDRIGFLGAAYAKIFSYSVTLIAYVFFYYKFNKKTVFNKLNSSE